MRSPSRSAAQTLAIWRLRDGADVRRVDACDCASPSPFVPVRPTSAAQKSRFRKSWGAGGKRKEYNFSAANDVLGIVMLEIQGVKDLLKLKNSKSHFFLRSVCVGCCG